MTPAIAIQNLQKSYGTLHALRGIDLTIGQGEFFGLLGPNGAGKSTLINILAGLTRADHGTASIMGYDVVRQYRDARHRLGVVPQELVFDPFFTVREVLRIQAGYFGLGRENDGWIEELMDALMLSDKANTNMRALSGGMKRRVLIAQALVHKPRVVVLDEPTAGVDVELRRSLWLFVQRLHREGHTIVLTTHYLEEAESLCQRIGIVNHGTLVALDTKQALLRQGIGTTVHLRVELDKPLDPIPESIAPNVKFVNGCTLELQLEKDQNSVIAILDQLRRAGANVIDLETERTDLEDVFIHLTGGGQR